MKSNKRLQSVLQNTETHPANHSNGCSIITKCLFSISKEPLPPPAVLPYTNQTRKRNNTSKRCREMKTATEELQYSTDVEKSVCIRGKKIKLNASFLSFIKPYHPKAEFLRKFILRTILLDISKHSQKKGNQVLTEAFCSRYRWGRR